MLIGNMTNMNNQSPLTIHKIIGSNPVLYFIRGEGNK